MRSSHRPGVDGRTLGRAYGVAPISFQRAGTRGRLDGSPPPLADGSCAGAVSEQLLEHAHTCGGSSGRFVGRADRELADGGRAAVDSRADDGTGVFRLTVFDTPVHRRG